MSSFTTTADMRIEGEFTFQMLAAFEFHVGQYPSEEIVTVPAGFVTDLASVPRALWSIFPPHGSWAKAAIVHDYLYSSGKTSRVYADRVFLEGMEVLGVPLLKRQLMYWAVRLFGESSFNATRLM